ncbi:MAG TPA: VCBS repeat-containing protein, partial [Longimicrobiales bacterium]
LDIGEWSRFIDLDRDGDTDLLAEQPFSYIRYYENQGTKQNAAFRLAADSLGDANGAAIFADRQNIPNLTDLDCDNQLDLFLGRVEGTLTRYEQTSSKTQFGFVTDRFEGIEIVAQIGAVEPPPSTRGPSAADGNAAKHGANTMYWADYDGDGDQDLFWGDFFEAGVLIIPNVGSCSSPNLRVEPQPFNVDGSKLTTSGYNVPALVDIDGDKDLDMFIGVLGGAYNPNRTASDNFYFVERNGASWNLRSTRFLNTIDIGSESVPAFADLNGDGLTDMLVGNKLDPKRNERARLYFFRNTGTAKGPAFALSDTLDLDVAFHYAPALGDIDQDGDADLLLGTWNEGVHVYRNQGTKQQPRFVRDSAATIKFERGSNFTPALADIDADGDLDLLVGEASGEMNLVRNAGSATAPQFKVESESWQNIDAGRRSHPAPADIDGDGDLDLISGHENSGVAYYRNDGTKQEPRFVPADMQLALPPHAAPALIDLNGDGKLELVTGSLSGGLTYWRI